MVGTSLWENQRGEWCIRTKPAFGEKEVARALKGRAGGPSHLGWAGVGIGIWRGSRGGSVDIDVNGVLEALDVDPVMGPKMMTVNGTTRWLQEIETGRKWDKRDSADQKVLAYKAARANVDMRGSMVEYHKQAAARAEDEERRGAEQKVNALRRELNDILAIGGSERSATEARCRMELTRPPVLWKRVTRKQVLAGHAQRAPGLIYGLEFPFNEDLLAEFGAEWLTKAFHAAGTLELSNRVRAVMLETEIKIDAGNNAGKFLFEVVYEKPNPKLHTKLFAKVPFQMTKETQSDRVSSSVMKQPMDLHEINTYRLMEASFPMQTPKYYFGDISCETSNFILITARIPYADIGANGFTKTLQPFEVEGPYDKCKDSLQLRSPPKEYYMLLVKTSAKIAGFDKAGKMLSPAMMKATMQAPPDGSDPANFGCKDGNSGQFPPDVLKGHLQNCITFVAETARPLFPDFVTEESFQEKFINTMMTWSAYSAELQYYLHSDPAYVGLGHSNLNSDNAYFWRGDQGELDCGIIDWGGFASGSLGHKMWWCFNCSDFDQFRSFLDEYVDAFVATYVECGGPQVDKETFKTHVLLTTLGNCMFMVLAVPDCFRMCARKEWDSITSRQDPRVANNVNGKSTLRTTLHVLNNCIRVLEEMGSDEALKTWIKEVWVGRWGKTPKSQAAIFGAVPHA